MHPGTSVDSSDTAVGPDQDLQVGWHADPFGRHGSRWWDGTAWTERVRTGRVQGIDPPGIVHAPAGAVSNEPAAPIDDAVLPISRPSVADKLAVALACLVFLSLVALLVVALTTT